MPPAATALVKLLACSLLGLSLFLLPFPYEGSWTVALGVITQELRESIGTNMRFLSTPIFVLGGPLAALYDLTSPRFAHRLPLARVFISGHWLWTALAVTIFLIIGFGALLLPFLTDYGLLDFIGVLLRKPFQAIFRLPGRATVDTLASWVGAFSIAVIMTGPITRFVLAGLSVTQLIFSAESAILITRSAIPLSVPQLPGILVIRTVIALPVLALLAHRVF